jgi:hypothetical protein
VPIETKESVRWQENVKQSTELLSEPVRCIHIGDAARRHVVPCAHLRGAAGERWPVHNRGGDASIKVKARHRVEVRAAKGAVSETTVRIKYHRLRVHPPIGKQKDFPPPMLTVIHAQEACVPRGREKIDWKLITNLIAVFCILS